MRPMMGTGRVRHDRSILLLDLASLLLAGRGARRVQAWICGSMDIASGMTPKSRFLIEPAQGSRESRMRKLSTSTAA